MEPTPPVVRIATPEDVPAIAAMRWEWDLENHVPLTVGRDEYVRVVSHWASAHAATHHCIVAARSEQLVGMVWLAAVPRIPVPTLWDRASGDLQSMYLRPDERNAGLGTRMIQALVELAERLGLDRITVNAGGPAVGFYERVGFERSATLLQRILPTG